MKHNIIISLVASFALGLLLWGSSCTQMTTPPNNSGIDTTSHDFSFSVDTLGYSGVLYDVTIIDENNIWAVGEVYLRDSTEQIDPRAYGFAVWNGQQWSLRRLEAMGPTGSISNLRPRGVFAFGVNDIWFASGGVFHWDGQKVTPYWINTFPGNPNPVLFAGQTAEKLWGTSSSNLYAVGNQSGIAYYNGNTWRRIGTGTSISLTDVWGTPAFGSQPQFVITVGSNLMTGADRHAFAVSPSGVKDTLNWTQDKTPFSIWFTPTSPYYISGNGVWRYSEKKWNEITPMNFVNRVRGSADNNILVAGSFAYVAHYNGSTWKEYPEISWPNGVLRGLDVHPKVVVAVGDAADVPIVIRGYPR